jgi:hypothetical protein
VAATYGGPSRVPAERVELSAKPAEHAANVESASSAVSRRYRVTLETRCQTLRTS